MLTVAHFSLAQSTPADTSELIHQLRAGDNEASVHLADKLLAGHPRDCRVLSLKGIALQNLKRMPEALAVFHSAATLCPAYLPALEGSAQVEYAQQSSETIATLTRILALQPDNVTAHAMMAVTLQRQARCSEALSHFQASESLFTQRLDLLQGSASCLAQTGAYQKSLEQYSLILEKQPSEAVRYDVAVLQWKTDMRQEALATLGPILANHANENALNLASRISEELGDTPHAVEYLRAAIELAPDKIENYLDFATIAFSHQSFQVGIDMIDAGLLRSPKASQLFLARGVLEVQVAKNDAAIEDFEQAHRLDPKLSFALDAVGMMRSQKHDDTGALAFFQVQAKDHPDDPLLHYLLAEQLAQAPGDTGRDLLKEAIVAAERAAALEPTYQPSHDLLASLYLRSKQPELAIKEAELALHINPNDDSALYQELMAKRRFGKNTETDQLTERLKAARETNAKSSRNTDRYRLQDDVAP